MQGEQLHPTAACPGPSMGPGPCPSVSDPGPGPGRPGLPPCPRRPGPQTAQQIGLQSRPATEQATGGVGARIKYETLPHHFRDLAASETLSSDRFKSTAAESYTFKRRDRCLNPEPVFSPAPPCGSVTFLKDTEERLARSSLPASRPRFSEYSEAFGSQRLSCADLVDKVTLQRPRLGRPSTDVLPRHVYTATAGVAGEVNPLLSTTSRDFQPWSAEAGRRYRSAPPADTFTGDTLLPSESTPQPRWHGFTPCVPHGGLTSETQQRYHWPRLDQGTRHNWTTPVEPPLTAPPSTRQLLGEAQFGRESDSYGTGRPSPVALTCGGLVSRQHHRRRLCSLRQEPQPGQPTCLPGPEEASESQLDDSGNYGLTLDRPPRVSQQAN